MKLDLLCKKGSRENHRDKASRYSLAAVSFTAAAIIFFIIAFIIANSAAAILDIGIIDFLTGNVWKPSANLYGAFPIIIGTLLVTFGSILFAIPLGIGASIFISEVVSDRVRNILKPVCEIFAGIPSVVYGFFGIIILVPFLKSVFPEHLDYGYSWLTGSILLGIMALPTIISISDDSMRAVPKSYREASIAMGATRWETTRKIIIPSAISGISAAVVLGIGRAIGETMAVMMVTGNTALVPDPLWNVFEMVRTITATLALEMPNVVIGSTHYSALFLLALVLMAMVLIINVIAKLIVENTKKRFMKNNEKDGLISRIVPKSTRKCISKYSNLLKNIIMIVLLLSFSYMIVSLFISPIYAVACAFIILATMQALRYGSKKINSMQREKCAHLACALAMICIIAILAILLSDIIIKGIPAISIDFLTSYPSNAGLSGGIYPAIVGTLKLIAGTLAIAFPLGVLTGVYLSEYAKNSRYTRLIKSAIGILNGTPSIVFGLFGMAAIVVYLGIGYSLIGGCITLSFLILPVIIKTTEESISSIPNEIREASFAMGASKWDTTSKVVLPAAFGGVLTGAILGLGRASGETAPIMFTAVVAYQGSMSSSIFDPIMALPYHLYYLASEVPGSMTNQYGTALVLLIIVLSMFTIASVIRHFYSKSIKW